MFKLGKNLLDVPSALPIAMKAASTREKKGRAAASVYFLRAVGEVTESDPGVPVTVRDRHRASCTIHRQVIGAVREREQPRVRIHQLGRAAAISRDFLGGRSRIYRAEEND